MLLTVPSLFSFNHLSSVIFFSDFIAIPVCLCVCVCARLYSFSICDWLPIYPTLYFPIQTTYLRHSYILIVFFACFFVFCDKFCLVFIAHSIHVFLCMCVYMLAWCPSKLCLDKQLKCETVVYHYQLLVYFWHKIDHDILFNVIYYYSSSSSMDANLWLL